MLALASLGEHRGAGEGNRTLVFSLGSWHSAVELRPRVFVPTSSGRVRTSPSVNFTVYFRVFRCLPRGSFSVLDKFDFCRVRAFMRFVEAGAPGESVTRESPFVTRLSTAQKVRTDREAGAPRDGFITPVILGGRGVEVVPSSSAIFAGRDPGSRESRP